VLKLLMDLRVLVKADINAFGRPLGWAISFVPPKCDGDAEADSFMSCSSIDYECFHVCRAAWNAAPEWGSTWSKAWCVRQLCTSGYSRIYSRLMKGYIC